MAIEIEILKDEVEKITRSIGLKTIELEAKRGPNGLNIIAVIDKDGGVTVSDCERVTRLLNDRIEILHPTEIDNYTLQVSSPGTSRVFKDKKEYDLFASKDVRVILSESLDKKHGSTILEGKLIGIKNDVVTIEAEGELIPIPLEKISKTKLNG
jgi:ribosome maturation factor RimP